MRSISSTVNSPYFAVAVISLLCSVLFSLGLNDALAYRRELIIDGQWYRLLTGNLLHTNLWHLVMNLAGFWVIVLLYQQHFNGKSLTILTLVLGLMQGLALLAFFPSTQGYVGLSGLLHGVFVYGAILDITKGIKSGYLLTLGVVLKVLYEQTYGASDEVTALIGATVATEAHLIGVVSGFICLAAVYFYHKSKNRKV